MATNGISIEEKIQKITEAIQGLVMAQITFLDSVDKKIERANKEQCADCKAMKMATAAEEEEEKNRLIEEWKKANGITDAPKDKDDFGGGWSGFFKKLLTQPGIWVFLTVLSISPYGVDIVKAIL